MFGIHGCVHIVVSSVCARMTETLSILVEVSCVVLCVCFSGTTQCGIIVKMLSVSHYATCKRSLSCTSAHQSFPPEGGVIVRTANAHAPCKKSTPGSLKLIRADLPSSVCLINCLYFPNIKCIQRSELAKT